MGKRIMGILGIFLGIVILIMSLTMTFASTGNFERSETYGGDAYTGIQNAAAQTANNLLYVSYLLRDGFANLLFAAGAILIWVSITMIVTSGKKNQIPTYVAPQMARPAMPVQPQVQPAQPIRPMAPQPQPQPAPAPAPQMQPQPVPQAAPQSPVAPQPQMAQQAQAPVAPQPQTAPQMQSPVAPQPQMAPQMQAPVAPQPQMVQQAQAPMAPQPQAAPARTAVPPTSAALAQPAVSYQVGKCKICGKEDVALYGIHVRDEYGTRYRKVCEECMKKAQA